MSDHESDEEQDLLDDVVVNKYKMAAEVTNSVLTELVSACVDGACIADLCELGDQRILEKVSQLYKKEKEMKKGISFPTTITVNNMIFHYSPINGEENDPAMLKNGDLVKIDIGAHLDGYAAVVGHTFVIQSNEDDKVTGRKADAILAAHTASEVILRLLRPGNENLKVPELIQKAVADFGCKPIEGVYCHQLKRMVYDAEKTIFVNPTEEQKKTLEKCTFDLNDVWDIDILVSTGDGKPREHKARTSIYRKRDTLYQLKMKASRQLYSDIANKFLVYPFNLRGLDDVKKARLGITECVKHNVIQAHHVLCEKDEEFVAQFRFTVLMMPNGPMRITGLPFQPALYKSEHKTKDAEIKEILAQPVKTQGKKKKTSKPQETGDKSAV